MLIICENNKYAAHTAIERRQAQPKLAERARVFGLPSEQLDGNDCELLLRTLERLVPAIRAGKGPHFIEIETYRYCGHVGPGDDECMAYRDAADIQRCKARAPLIVIRKRLDAVVDRAELERTHPQAPAQTRAPPPQP